MTRGECERAMANKQLVQYTGLVLIGSDEPGMMGRIFKIKGSRSKVFVAWKLRSKKRYMTWVNPAALKLVNEFWSSGTLTRGKRKMRI